MAINNERGQALLEGLPVFGLLTAFLLAVLVALYVLFGRAWIQFNAEQALLCLSERRGEGQCKTELEAKLDHFLHFGDWHVRLATLDQSWSVDVEWKLKGFSIRVVKNLNLKLAAKAKVLPL